MLRENLQQVCNLNLKHSLVRQQAHDPMHNNMSILDWRKGFEVTKSE